jgi:cysteine sulfinate desulfinase/cysteine desulfurase-like protein
LHFFFFLASEADFLPFFLHFFFATWANESVLASAAEEATAAPSSASASSEMARVLRRAFRRDETMRARLRASAHRTLITPWRVP